MDFVLYEADGAVATITINRPKALNALNSQVLDELDQTLDAIDLDTVRCVILTGAGDKSFVAGADIGEMSTLTKAEGEAFGKKGNDVFRKLETLPIPVIAAVNGFALGGGCEISMSCDIRICSENAMFGQPEAGLGITPGFGGTQRLARTVGVGMAKQLIYTARNIKAAEAYRIGLVNKVVAKEELMSTAKDMAKKIISKGSYAVSIAKAAINNGYDMDISGVSTADLAEKDGEIALKGYADVTGETADETFNSLIGGNKAFTIEAVFNPNNVVDNGSDYNLIASKGDSSAAFLVT